MQIPETPTSVVDLDLMKLLAAYAEGTKTWNEDVTIGEDLKAACQMLHSNLVDLVNNALARLLERVNVREMETFTMHDRKHGLKVAHLMWHILDEKRRQMLTPPEIAMLVLAAYLHDLGMFISNEDRDKYLSPDSELWVLLEIDANLKGRMDRLRGMCQNEGLEQYVRDRARRRLVQAEEALLARYLREQHASKERYTRLLERLQNTHLDDPEKLPDIARCLSFQGDSFCDQLIDVCVSHNQEAGVLVERDPANPERPRFRRDFPVGDCCADLQLIAATLRLADILDFDRERTPSVLFHYLLPTHLAAVDDKSILEWNKHLAISSWSIEPETIIFRGRCDNHVVHHAIVQFAAAIQEEISATTATYCALGDVPMPFRLPSRVQADIHAEGYTYVPYHFELDDERIYNLLMGGAIYDNPLVAVRELIQNAVDACKLKDAMIMRYESYMQPGSEDRITISYEEATEAAPMPRLIVQDTGTGMDGWILERYFLKVGRSFYRSSEFSRHRMVLRQKDLDFAPVSEFGIGFLSCFLVADRLVIETAMWEPMHGNDTRKRVLTIDGPTRLIRLAEHENTGPNRFRGTRVTLHLSGGGKKPTSNSSPPTWEQVSDYIKDVCEDLPYTLTLVHRTEDEVSKEVVLPKPIPVFISKKLELGAIRIAINDEQAGIEGEVVLLNYEKDPPRSSLLRGGFRIGDAPVTLHPSTARLRLTWKEQVDQRFQLPNLARTEVTGRGELEKCVVEWIFRFLLDHLGALPEATLARLRFTTEISGREAWLRDYNAQQLYRLARPSFARIAAAVKSELSAWEQGNGEVLQMGSEVRSLASLSSLVLPRVTTPMLCPVFENDEVVGFDTYLSPPISGWEAHLASISEYDDIPLYNWLFGAYEDPFSEFLLIGQAVCSCPKQAFCFFNERYQEQMSEFSETQLIQLGDFLYDLCEMRGELSPAKQQGESYSLLEQLFDLVGDAPVSSGFGESRPLGSFLMRK